MGATFVQNGDSIDYTPTVDVTAGGVIVQGSLVGVAKLDIKANELGALAVDGVFDFPKGTNVGDGKAAGTKMYWDSANGVATSVATANTLIGKQIKISSDADTTARIRMNQ